MTVHVPEPKTIEAQSLAQIFTDARTHNAFVDKPVSDELLKRATELAKMGPTSANQSPLRVLFLRSRAAKERLRPALSPGNLDKTMSAPVVAVTAYDELFYEHLPFLFPHADAKPWFSGDPVRAARSAFQNGTLQVAYLIIALRAVGLDTGPMTGFDNAKVDAEFFPEGHVKSNVLINIGYGDHEKLFPRSPRFSFDQIAKIL
jgi:3-hydroxypropanoate dehydrogenase